MKKCPICGKEYNTHSVISIKDNKKEICLRCGFVETLNASLLEGDAKRRILRIYDGK
jgi:hypothetical protein